MTRKPRPPARIVVVDDDRLTRELARDALAPEFDVECCESGEAALEALTRKRADLVISDLTMPGLSGMELLERVSREHPRTEFALLTANASVDTAIEALRMGAADYLLKPIRPQELALVTQRILARRRILMENARLRETLSTVDSCRTLLRCLEIGEIYAVTLDLLLSILSRERGFALFKRGAAPLSDCAVFRGFDEDQARRLRDLVFEDKPVDIDSVGLMGVISDGPLHEALRSLGIPGGPALAAPVEGADAQSGVLWVFEDGKPLPRAALTHAQLVVGHAQVALDNAQRYDQAKERAFIDDVTEVYNARYLLQASERELQRAQRYDKDLSVLFLDLDRFKLVNDQYGHLVGSQVLRDLSKLLGECVRQVDTLARYGGDEFTILLTDTDPETAQIIAERIRRTVSEHLFEGGRDAPIRLTISIGVASYPRHAQERDGLLELSDKAMYRAKSQGRNCVCTADDLN